VTFEKHELGAFGVLKPWLFLRNPNRISGPIDRSSQLL
jgi:hypothetical protein